MEREDSDRELSTAERFAALSRVGAALMSELDESRLLHLIAETACTLTGAQFAAFSLRPVDESGQPLVPSEGNLFHLAAVVGVTKEQEALFRRTPLGGEGLLAPIFRHGVSVRVPDVLSHLAHNQEAHSQTINARNTARDLASAYSDGQLSTEDLRSMGIPRGHPLLRSFLGVPLLDRDKQVRGGLLLGHIQPDQFTAEDEALLIGLASQAAVALENARLYRSMQMRSQELNAIFENIADGITLINGQAQILRENETARRLRNHVQGSPEGSQMIESLLHAPARSALKDELVQHTTVILHDQYAEIREYLVTASPLHIPTHSGPLSQQMDEKNTAERTTSGAAVVVWHDVTERRIREAERAAKEVERQMHAETEANRALLQLILDELPSSVYLVRGSDARLVLANRAATAIWGATWPQGQPFATFLQEHGIRIMGMDGQLLQPEQFATLRAVRHGENVYQHQESIRHADGTTLPVLVNAVTIDSHHLAQTVTKPLHAAISDSAAIVVHQDVTALKEAEQLKDEFVGLAAHELRTPVAILKGFAQTLIMQTARGKGPALADWQTEALQGIDQATIRLVELTEDLLDVTRLQAGRLELQLEPTNLIPLVQRLVRRVQMTTERHQISIDTTLPYLVASVDSRRIEQVLNNILGNAIKYCPAGGPIEVRILQDEQEQMALLSVKDHGIGIPLHQQARIFDRFTRAENAQAYGIGGTGLGLYLCRELVERHSGHIWFESHEGTGSTFFISLPLLPVAPEDIEEL